MLGRSGPAIALLAACALTGGCVSKSSSPVAPSTGPAPASTLPLVVQVVTRGAEAPIPGASVFENDKLVGRTDGTGVVNATVSPGVEFHITVTASGYAGNGAWGTVNSEERWTFYLEPQPQ